MYAARMETWQLVIGGGALLGLAALAGMIWSFKKLEAPKKWVAMAVFALVGAGGGYLASNATAFTTTEEEAEIEQQIQESDFEAELDDDF